MIDLRSDTVTRPSEEMRRAMAAADVGDDVYGEDPTVNALEERVAAMFGMPAALYVHGGIQTRTIVADRGLLEVDAVAAQLRFPGYHTVPTRAVAVEQTHNRGGGA